jgi:pimeloyl-ACP methyl ester carboxylesterase
MPHLLRLIVSLFLMTLFLGAQSRPAAAAVPGPCSSGVFPSGALWLVCVPVEGWNGQLVAFTHGYVQPREPLGFYNLEIDGTSIPALLQSLGFAFATTSYRKNGLSILQGVEDIRDLVRAAPRIIGVVPTRVWLTGVSEGGLVAALAAERHPALFDGAYSACGPVGDFRYQINHIGHFRVLFDYFYEGVIPGSPTAPPAFVQAGWDTLYKPLVLAALAADPARAAEFLRVARVPFDSGNPVMTAGTVIALLEYNIFGAVDATRTLGGQPFDNRFHWYSGSRNDLRLNLRVRRFAADPAALLEMRKYSTSGELVLPFVTIHTTGDGVVPFAHELLYALKARTSGRGAFLPLPVFRYGHCALTAGEVLFGFGLMLAQ